MGELLVVLVLAAIPGVSGLLGALGAEAVAVSPRALSAALHLAAGIVVAVVGLELMPRALAADPAWVPMLAFIADRRCTSRNGHSFILANPNGEIDWRADYGGPPITRCTCQPRRCSPTWPRSGSMNSPVEITLLTQQQCRFCDLAKEILDGVGRDYPLRIREVDLATAQGQRLATAVGVLFAPGVLLDGAAFSYGRLSERKLRRELDRRTSNAEETLHTP